MNNRETLTMFQQLLAEPDRLVLIVRVLEDPERGLAALDDLIRSPKTSDSARERWKAIRESLERYALEVGDMKAGPTA